MNDEPRSLNVLLTITLTEGGVAAYLADSWLTGTILLGGASLLYVASQWKRAD